MRKILVCASSMQATHDSAAWSKDMMCEGNSVTRCDNVAAVAAGGPNRCCSTELGAAPGWCSSCPGRGGFRRNLSEHATDATRLELKLRQVRSPRPSASPHPALAPSSAAQQTEHKVRTKTASSKAWLRAGREGPISRQVGDCQTASTSMQSATANKSAQQITR